MRAFLNRVPHGSQNMAAAFGLAAALGLFFEVEFPYDWGWIGCGDETNSLAYAASWARTGVPSYGVNAEGEEFTLGALISPLYYLLYGPLLYAAAPEAGIDVARSVSKFLVLAAIALAGGAIVGPSLGKRSKTALAAAWAGALLLIAALYFNSSVFMSAHFGRLDALGLLGSAAFAASFGAAWREFTPARLGWALFALIALAFMNFYAFAVCLFGAAFGLLVRISSPGALRFLLIAIAALGATLVAYLAIGRIFFGAGDGSHTPDIVARYLSWYGNVQLDPRRMEVWQWPLTGLVAAALVTAIHRLSDGLRLLFIAVWIGTSVFLLPVHRLSYDGMLIVLGVTFWFASTPAGAANWRPAQAVACAVGIFVLFANVLLGDRIAPSAASPLRATPWSQDTFDQQPAANRELREANRALIERLEALPDGIVVSVEPQHALLQARGVNVMLFNPNAASGAPHFDRYLELLPDQQVKYVVLNSWFCQAGGPLCDLHNRVVADPSFAPDEQIGRYRVTLIERMTLPHSSDYFYCAAGMYPMSLLRIEQAPRAL